MPDCRDVIGGGQGWTATLDRKLTAIPVPKGDHANPTFSADGNSTVQLLLLEPKPMDPVELLRTRVPGPFEITLSPDGKLLAYSGAGSLFLSNLK